MINYFLRQLWNRKAALEAILKEQRLKEPQLRTQIRMGDTDLILMTKYQGEPFFRPTPINAYGDIHEYVLCNTDKQKRKEISPVNRAAKKHKVGDLSDESGDELVSSVSIPDV